MKEQYFFTGPKSGSNNLHRVIQSQDETEFSDTIFFLNIYYICIIMFRLLCLVYATVIVKGRNNLVARVVRTEDKQCEVGACLTRLNLSVSYGGQF